ncbi:MAG: hypothetical protein KA715_03630 [Xanthomonadaceae bacterium]|nr:hypothetical protein [Xanthomonadaceae bacterium]
MWLFAFLFHSALSQPPIEYITQFEVENPIVVSTTVPVCREAYESAAAHGEKWTPGLLVISSFEKKNVTKNRVALINSSSKGKKAAAQIGDLKKYLEAAYANPDSQELNIFVKKITKKYYKKTLHKPLPKKVASEERQVRLLLKNGYENGKFCPDIKIKKTGELKRAVKTQSAVARDVINQLPKTAAKISVKQRQKKKT